MNSLNSKIEELSLGVSTISNQINKAVEMTQSILTQVQSGEESLLTVNNNMSKIVDS